jgi:hypothetical protein
MALKQEAEQAGRAGSAMADNFLACDRDQAFLLPGDLRDWLPADHLAWFHAGPPAPGPGGDQPEQGGQDRAPTSEWVQSAWMMALP